jgi:menaquinone-dependent protoporphyrinogen oxidase
MVKVLVVYASREGATGEIAREIMHELRDRGVEVDFRPANEVSSLDGFGAVVLGSGIHLRHWDMDAMRFLERHASGLARRQTWLYQSGPYARHGESQHADPPQAIVERAAQIGAEGPRVFTGNLSGQLRNCDEVKAWTDQIADQLLSDRVVSSSSH